MIFRLSQKLNGRVKVSSLRVLPMDENPLADWSAHVFSVNHIQYIIICNTKSLYSSVMFAKGITSENQFITRALGNLREFMEYDGQESAYESLIAPASASVQFAKALDRSVTGSMNDLIHMAKFHLIKDAPSLHELGIVLNITPFSKLDYANPRKVFMSLLKPIQ